jgi:hypothetical protein
MAMKSLVISSLALAGWLFVSAAQAQDEPGLPAGGQFSPSDLPPPVQPLWQPAQDSRSYLEPRQIARQKSAEEAELRRSRLSAQRWYGYSPLRPTVMANPIMGNYFPIWNTDVYRPRQWYGVSSPIVLERAAVIDVR